MTTANLQNHLRSIKLNKIEKNKLEKDGLLIGKNINKLAQMGQEEIDETDLKLRLKWYGVFWRPKTPGKFMLRLRIPNGILQTSMVTNFSSEDRRRIIWTFSIAYGDDFNKAKNLLLKWIKEDQRILNDQEPMVVLSELADSSVNIMVRVWVKSENFLGVKFDFNEKVYNEFPKNGLSIPFPQLDVNLSK